MRTEKEANGAPKPDSSST